MITFTNIEGKRQNPGKWIDTDDVEKKAFVGCLLFWGAKTKTNKQTNKKQQNMQSTEMLFDPLYGEGLVRSTITRKRFMQLLTNLRFDDKATRNAQRARDVFAPFRDFWEDCRSAFRNGTFLDHLSALMSSWYRSADVAHSCSTCHLYQIAMAWRYFGLQMQSQTSHWLPSHAWGDLLDKKGRSTLEETQPSSWQCLSSRPEEMSQQVISSLTKTWPTHWWAMASHLLELFEPTSASCQKRSRSRKGNSSMSLHLFSKKSWPW